jgi:hypothetical protein
MSIANKPVVGSEGIRHKMKPLRNCWGADPRGGGVPGVSTREPLEFLAPQSDHRWLRHFVFHHGGTEKSRRFTEKTNSVVHCVISVPPG